MRQESNTQNDSKQKNTDWIRNYVYWGTIHLIFHHFLKVGTLIEEVGALRYQIGDACTRMFFVLQTLSNNGQNAALIFLEIRTPPKCRNSNP